MTYLKDAIQQLTDVVQQNMNKTHEPNKDEFQWDVNVEILFLHSLFGLKPVGVNRFFTMREIHSRFSNFMQRELSSKILWDHLDSMYDMAALHESEVLPFPNEETPFELSEEFDDLVKEKFGVSLTHSVNENDASKSASSLKDAKKLNTPKLKQMLPPATNAKTNTFLSPGAVKTTDSRPSSTESNSKVTKSDPQSVHKSGKVKRASSPKNNGKPEVAPVVKEETPEVPSSKKKPENSSSGKKPPKSELSSSGTSSTRKSFKQDPVTSSGKSKNETPESSGKKSSKPEKEVVGKKGRVSSTDVSSSSRKNSLKGDGKKTDTDNPKKLFDTPSQKTKPERNSTAGNKSSRHEDSPVPSGSKKQSTGKVVVDDKKRRRSKVDDSAKKTPATKRRRI